MSSVPIISWGTVMIDIIATDLPRVATPGIILYVPKGIEARVGGHPIDLAIDLVQLGINPARIGVVSTIGRDIFGRFLEEELRKHKIRDFVQRVAAATGKTLILVIKGEDRRCHLDPGACLHMSITHLEKVLRKTKPQFFTFRPGYTNIDLKFNKLLARLRKNELKKSFLLLDVCAPYRKPWEYAQRIVKYVDVVHGNRFELTRIAGEKNFNSAVKKLLSLGARAILLTKDKEGAELITIERRVVQPAFKVKAVEPSGAGDAFCAGVIYWLYFQKVYEIDKLSKEELGDLLLHAQAFGASAVTRVGCTQGVTKERVTKLMNSQKTKILSKTKFLSSNSI